MNTKTTSAIMSCDECGTEFSGMVETGIADISRELGVPLKGTCPGCKYTLYCVMIPTHRNPTGGWFDFKWRRKFSRGHDDAIKKSVATFFGGYTLILPVEGCWKPGPDVFQVEGMRPLLFTAPSEWKANIITDVVCHHYGQEAVMLSVWSKDVQFRSKREGLRDVYTTMLYPNRPSLLKKVLNRLQRALRRALVGRNA